MYTKARESLNKVYFRHDGVRACSEKLTYLRHIRDFSPHALPCPDKNIRLFRAFLDEAGTQQSKLHADPKNDHRSDPGVRQCPTVAIDAEFTSIRTNRPVPGGSSVLLRHFTPTPQFGCRLC